MNLCMFFEGTGQGVAGRMTNVTRLRDLCAADARQKLHLEARLGTHFGSYLAGRIAGVDWRTTFRSARRWFEANYETLPKDGLSIHTPRYPTFGAPSTAFAAFSRASDSTSPVKGSEILEQDDLRTHNLFATKARRSRRDICILLSLAEGGFF